jgi:hypothetical protein
VREALLGSVTWAAPPESFQTSQLSTVPNASPPAAARARPGHVVEQPRELGRGEVGVEYQSRLLRDARLEAARAQPIASGGGAPVLPDDRVGDRRPGRAIPHHGGLALVGDADRGDVRRLDVGARHGFHRHGKLGAPDFSRVVLHPAWLRKDLAELPLGNRLDRPRTVEHDGARTGRTLV